MTNKEITTSEVSKRIYVIRGMQVMLDSDLAEIYEVETKNLKRAVKRNIERFPNDFMFELTKSECEFLRSQFVTLRLDAKFQPYMPFAFTEIGVGMLSSVLHSEKAIEVNIEIMRAFVQLRKQNKVVQSELVPRMEYLEKELSALKQKLVQLEIQKPRCVPPVLAFAEPEQVRMIQNAVAKRWGLNAEDLRSPSRSRDVALARHIAIYLVRKQLHMSFTQIGRCFGRRDHSTILHAYHKINSEIDVNRMIQDIVDSIKRETN